jgi:hypothetical protein
MTAYIFALPDTVLRHVVIAASEEAARQKMNRPEWVLLHRLSADALSLTFTEGYKAPPAELPKPLAYA